MKTAELEELEECTFMDEEFFGFTGTYNQENEEFYFTCQNTSTDEQILILKSIDDKLKSIQETIEKMKTD